MVVKSSLTCFDRAYFLPDIDDDDLPTVGPDGVSDRLCGAPKSKQSVGVEKKKESPAAGPHNPTFRAGGWVTTVARTWFGWGARTKRVEELPAVATAALDQAVLTDGIDLVEEEIYALPHEKEKRERVGFVQDLVAGLKAEHGPHLRRDIANEGVIRRQLFKEMKEHGMRPTHIAEQIDLALNAFWMLSIHQRLALAISASDAMADDVRVRRFGYRSGPWYDRRYSQRPPPVR